MFEICCPKHQELNVRNHSEGKKTGHSDEIVPGIITVSDKLNQI